MTIQYPVYKPYLNGNEKIYVNQCLDSSWISSQGEFIERFEQAFAEYIGMPYALSCTNGTVALHLALLTLGITHGDEVILPALTYVAGANAVHYVGATPIFIDSEPEFFQMDVNKVEAKITSKTKAIIAVHLYGHVCEMDKLTTLAKKYNLYLIEDCAEAIGSQYHDQKAGTFGDIATFSFFGNKTITTGEGGMVMTKNKALAKKVFKLKGQGVSAHTKYLHDIVGYNYRMTNICCAIGLAQLENIELILNQKSKIANWYQSALGDYEAICFHPQKEGTLHTYWLVSILLKNKIQRDGVMAYLLAHGIDSRPFFVPMHKLPIYKSNLSLPIAENLSERGLNLPSYPALTESDVKHISLKIREFSSL